MKGKNRRLRRRIVIKDSEGVKKTLVHVAIRGGKGTITGRSLEDPIKELRVVKNVAVRGILRKCRKRTQNPLSDPVAPGNKRENFKQDK
jgi:hypothetical protein